MLLNEHSVHHAMCVYVGCHCVAWHSTSSASIILIYTHRKRHAQDTEAAQDTLTQIMQQGHAGKQASKRDCCYCAFAVLYSLPVQSAAAQW